MPSPSCGSSSARSVAITVAPSRASRRASAAPCPPAAPVTTTILPSTRPIRPRTLLSCLAEAPAEPAPSGRKPHDRVEREREPPAVLDVSAEERLDPRALEVVGALDGLLGAVGIDDAVALIGAN